MPCLGSASQLKGEQNFHIPCVGTGERAACCPICPSIVILTPDTLARGNPPGEGAATKRRTTDGRRAERSKPPDPHEEGLPGAGGVPPILGNSPAFPEDVDTFGLHRSGRERGRRGTQTLAHWRARTRGGRCWSRAL